METIGLVRLLNQRLRESLNLEHPMWMVSNLVLAILEFLIIVLSVYYQNWFIMVIWLPCFAVSSITVIARTTHYD